MSDRAPSPSSAPTTLTPDQLAAGCWVCACGIVQMIWNFCGHCGQVAPPAPASPTENARMQYVGTDWQEALDRNVTVSLEFALERLEESDAAAALLHVREAFSECHRLLAAASRAPFTSAEGTCSLNGDPHRQTCGCIDWRPSRAPREAPRCVKCGRTSEKGDNNVLVTEGSGPWHCEDGHGCAAASPPSPAPTPTTTLDELERLYREYRSAAHDYALADRHSTEQKRANNRLVETAHRWETAINAAWPALLTALRSSASALAEAEQDTQRLDWLESHPMDAPSPGVYTDGLLGLSRGHVVDCRWTRAGKATTLRAAVDAARAALAPGHPTEGP